MAHTCSPKIYNLKTKEWENNPNGKDNKGLYIGTEMLLLEEIDPIIWAYMSGVPQEHIVYNMYEEGEEERVDEAIRILEEEGHIYLEYIPEFDVQTLEQVIEEHKLEHDISHVWFDYIHSTVELVSEYTSQARMHVREDQVLLNLSKEIKKFCRIYNISMEAGTQISGDWKNEKNRDETIVRGAKSIVDKADGALIAMPPTVKEIELIEPLMRKGFGNNIKPNLVYSLYKNRGGKLTKIKIWLYIDYDTMRVYDLFCTDYDYNLRKDIEKTYINMGAVA